MSVRVDLAERSDWLWTFKYKVKMLICRIVLCLCHIFTFLKEPSLPISHTHFLSKLWEVIQYLLERHRWSDKSPCLVTWSWTKGKKGFGPNTETWFWSYTTFDHFRAPNHETSQPKWHYLAVVKRIWVKQSNFLWIRPQGLCSNGGIPNMPH